jgi:hypothetical protein
LTCTARHGTPFLQPLGLFFSSICPERLKIYNGNWWAPECTYVRKAIAESQEFVEGKVDVRWVLLIASDIFGPS